MTIISVFNNLAVRQHCLDRSITDLRAEVDDVEYLPIDNTRQQFASAGAALNHGAALARHDYLVFVHQDVYLHSLIALEQAAARMAFGDIGLLGAAGVDRAGAAVGQIRDRLVLLGRPAPEPVDVDSIDEVLFMVPKSLLHREPLSAVPQLAWHAYAVEYGLRMRSLGLRTAVGRFPLTHNSLTINLARLDVAHAAVADRYPQALPVRTTCGIISGSQPGPAAAAPSAPSARSAGSTRPAGSTRSAESTRWGRLARLAGQRWRYRWLKESAAVHAARAAAGGGRFVLSDIRRDVDDVLAETRPGRFSVLNLDPGGPFAGLDSAAVDLCRRGRTLTFRSGSIDTAATMLAEAAAGDSVLITNLDVGNLRKLAPSLPRDRLVGYHQGIGCWVLTGPVAHAVPDQWRSPRARPLGLPSLLPAGD